MSKTRASCFIRGSKHLETIKELGLRTRAFICFSVFGTPDETLALVFDILRQDIAMIQGSPRYRKINLSVKKGIGLLSLTISWFKLNTLKLYKTKKQISIRK